MDEAKTFARRHLKNLKGKIEPRLEEQVDHALELPIHYRMLRLEARWYIYMYEKADHMDPLILELAKLDFNILQASYKREVQNGYRWWRQLGIVEKLPFIRDRWLESYLFSLSKTFEPQYGYGREVLGKVNQMITTIDDIYDVYGTIEERKLFTDAVDRWDTNAMQHLPEYMKICYLALLDFSNDPGYDTLKEQGCDVIPHLSKMNELARGDVAKSIQCYMHEADVSELVAREHIRGLSDEGWKKMNKEYVAGNLFPLAFTDVALGLARRAECMYLKGDGFGHSDSELNAQVMSLVVEPIPINGI